MPLKLILMSPDGTVGADGQADEAILRDLCVFIRRMAELGVQVALWSRTLKTLNGEPLEAYLSRESKAPVKHFLAGTAQYPTRQRNGSVDPILTETGAKRHETILVGNQESDMQAGVNNKLLLLRPSWYATEMPYGFPVDSISELARFCEIFAGRNYPIYWSINHLQLQVRSMGPFSTRIPDFAEFGYSARETAKEDAGDPEFWFFAVVSALYFSGLVHEVDYFCSFPGHNPNSTGGMRELLDQVMSRFAKCFNKQYLPDLIIRHTASQKSQYLRPNQKTFANQINTLHLNRYPRSYDKTEARKTPLRLNGKHVLIVDDFITNGRSLDSARAFIEAAGARAILFSWLKTINTSFEHMNPDPQLNPYQPCAVAREPTTLSYRYHDFIVAPRASSELASILRAYRDWAWP
jgi:hypothetical protein